MKKDAGVDVLTGVGSREGLGTAVEALVRAAQEKGTALSIALVDIDFFNRINTEHGRAAGDEVLRNTARALREFLRKGEKAMETVFRRGGDEFALLLPGMEKEEAHLRLEALRQAVSAERTYQTEHGKRVLKVTVSIGLATFPDDGDSGPDIVRKATDAVLRAKATGRNRVCLAREEKMVTKTSHYTQGQLAALRQLAEKQGVGDAVLLREALNDLLAKYDREQNS
jgi:diguanylate cyclase (GGDEF)-like protein